MPVSASAAIRSSTRGEPRVMSWNSGWTLTPGMPLSLQVAQVLLVRQVRVDRAERDEAAAVDRADELVGPGHVLGDVGDAEGERPVDAGIVHGSRQARDGAVMARIEA